MKDTIKMSMVAVFFAIILFTLGTGGAIAEEKVFKLGSIFGYTGAVATVQTLFSNGFSDYIRYFNETRGADLHPGLKGITIEHVSVDSGYTVPGYLKQFWKLVEEGHQIIYSVDAKAGDAVKPLAAKEHIVIITGSMTDHQMFPPGWVFGAGLGYPEAYAAVVDWALKHHNKARPLRLVWMTHDNPFGMAPVKKCTAYAKDKGVEVFGPVFIPMVPIDISAELNTVMRYEPDYVFMNISEALPATMANVERMGIHKKGVRFLNYWPSKAAFETAQDACEESLYFNFPWGIYGDGSPGMRLVEKTVNTYRKGTYPGDYYAVAEYNARAMLGAIETALEKVTFDKVDGENIKKYGRERMRNYDMLGIGPSLTFTPDERRGIKHTRIVEIKNGKFVAKTPYILCPDLSKF